MHLIFNLKSLAITRFSNKIALQLEDKNFNNQNYHRKFVMKLIINLNIFENGKYSNIRQKISSKTSFNLSKRCRCWVSSL